MKNLNVAIIQTALAWEDKEYNLDKLEIKISLIKEGTDIVLLPETFSTGFSMLSKSLAEPMDGKAIKWMSRVAKEQNLHILGTLIIEDGGNYYNRMIVMGPQGIQATYDKRHLFSMAKEDKYYTPGTEKTIWNFKGWRLCLQTCYDLRFPVTSRNTGDYDALIYVANWPEKRAHPWKTLLLARAMENQTYVLACNRIGKDALGNTYSGDSAIINPMGEYIQEGVAHEEEIYYAELDWKFLEKSRKQFPVLNDSDSFTLTSE